MNVMSANETPEIDTSRPHPARMWNYWIGGKDYYEIDKQVGDQVAAAYPPSATSPGIPVSRWDAWSGISRPKRGSGSSSMSAPGFDARQHA